MTHEEMLKIYQSWLTRYSQAYSAIGQEGTEAAITDLPTVSVVGWDDLSDDDVAKVTKEYCEFTLSAHITTTGHQESFSWAEIFQGTKDEGGEVVDCKVMDYQMI